MQVGVWQHDRVEIIANEQGNRTTPSYVAFGDTERLVGDAAKNQAAMNPINTVFDAKRLIGRKFTDPIVQADMKLWCVSQRAPRLARSRSASCGQQCPPPPARTPSPSPPTPIPPRAGPLR